MKMESRLSNTQLHTLLNAISTINSSLNLDETLENVMSEISLCLDVERSTLYIVDHKREQIWSKILQGDQKLEIRLPIGQGISGYVAKTGEILKINDPYQDPRFNPEVDKKSGFKTRNILCAPIYSQKGRIIGVLQSLNKQAGEFSDEDIFFVKLFSDHIAMAIQNAILHNEALERQKLEQEMTIASRIQEMLLPQQLPKIPGYDFYTFQKPSRQIGGDYYDYWKNDTNLNMLIADVAGKGIPAALLMSNLQASANFLMNYHEKLDEINDKLNKHIFKITTEEKFITAILAQLDFKNHIFSYIRSGHVPPIFISTHTHSITCHHLNKGGIPLGIMPDFNYTASEIEIGINNLLIMCSDGIIEAQDENGNTFGTERLAECGVEFCHLPVKDIGDNILKKVRKFSDNGQLDDDMTLMIIKRVENSQHDTSV